MVDNFFTGRKRNVEHWIGHENFELIHQDVIEPLYIEVDQIYHLACPASPPHYMYNPIKTIKVSSVYSAGYNCLVDKFYWNAQYAWFGETNGRKHATGLNI